MKKKTIITVVAAVVCVAVACIAVFVASDGLNRFKRQQAEIERLYPDVNFLSGMLLYGVSGSPYNEGDIRFISTESGSFRYKSYGADGVPEKIESGFDASSWTKIENGGIISGTDCRNICVVTVNSSNIVEGAAMFDYVPGVIYGYSNPDQYDDPDMYNSENPTLEDDRAVRLASNLFKTADTSYYGRDYGYISQGYLTKYSTVSGLLLNYYHTGTDFTVHQNRPFYSPIDGVLYYAGSNTSDDFNSIIIYNEENDISLLILHGEDISPAKALLGDKSEVEIKKGELLGYGGGAGVLSGDSHIHIEVRVGEATSYKSFSKDVQYSRIDNYDPLILADMFDLAVLEEDAYEPFESLGTDAFSALNKAVTVQVGSWLYYSDTLNGGMLCKSRPDGSGRIVLNGEANAICLNYSDGYIYYSDRNNFGHLTKTNIETGETLDIAGIDTRDYVLVINQKVYVVNTLSTNQLYTVNTDGTQFGAVRQYDDMRHIFYYDGAFYYTRFASAHGDRIWKYDTATGEITQMIQNRSDKPFVYNGKLCYRAYYQDKNCFTLAFDEADEAKNTKLFAAAYDCVVPVLRYQIFTNENDGSSLYITFDDFNDVYKLCDDLLCASLSYCGGWLYYTTTTDMGLTVCRINMQTLKRYEMQADGEWLITPYSCDEKIEAFITSSRTHGSMLDVYTAYATPTPTPEPEEEATPTPTPAADTPTPEPSAEVTPEPSDTPEPSGEPSEEPSDTPEPSGEPSDTPEPSGEPSEEPSEEPQTPPEPEQQDE